jgi:hypothetical protein
VKKVKKDYCVRCGSEDIRTVKKLMEFKIQNPGKVSVEQECEECQDCSETYMKKGQISELSGKLKMSK